MNFVYCIFFCIDVRNEIISYLEKRRITWKHTKKVERLLLIFCLHDQVKTQIIIISLGVVRYSDNSVLSYS